MRKLANFLLIAVMTACATGDNIPDIVKVCVDLSDELQSCGTGFFVASDRLVTSLHVLEESRDGWLRVLRKGRDVETNRIYNIPGTEIVVAIFDEDIIEPTAEICERTIEQRTVDMVGVLDWREGPEWIEGVIDDVVFGWIWVTGNAEKGYSGGPVYDIHADCYAGTIYGQNITSNFVVASNISTHREAILGPEELIEAESEARAALERAPDFDSLETLLLSE